MTTAIRDAAQSYRRNAILTASPEKLVVLLYDGAIRFLDRGRQAIENGNVAGAGEAISRAFAVVSELRSALDHDKGGEVAGHLESLYAFVQDRIIQANRSREVQPLDEARSILVTLKEGWDGLCGRA